jgi:hypothetical protein
MELTIASLSEGIFAFRVIASLGVWALTQVQSANNKSKVNRIVVPFICGTR